MLAERLKDVTVFCYGVYLQKLIIVVWKQETRLAAARAGVICISCWGGGGKEYMRGFATSVVAQGDKDGKRKTSENLHLSFFSQGDLNRIPNPKSNQSLKPQDWLKTSLYED